MVGTTFAPVVADDGTLDVTRGQAVDADQTAASDKVALQSYGRPYSDAGKPVGTYYAYAKPHVLPVFQ